MENKEIKALYEHIHTHTHVCLIFIVEWPLSEPMRQIDGVLKILYYLPNAFNSIQI